MIEQWLPIDSYPYSVSSLGRVMNAKGCILKPYKTDGRYLVVKLAVNGISKNHKVHRLVAAAFIEREEGRPHVNHKDFDKQNNTVQNLEWCSHLENTEHYLRFGSPNRSYWVPRSDRPVRHCTPAKIAYMKNYRQTYTRPSRQWRTVQGPLTREQMEVRAERARNNGRSSCASL